MRWASPWTASVGGYKKMAQMEIIMPVNASMPNTREIRGRRDSLFVVPIAVSRLLTFVSRSAKAISLLLKLYQHRLKSEDLGTPYYLPPRQGALAEGWPPSALPLLMITLLADLILFLNYVFKGEH